MPRVLILAPALLLLVACGTTEIVPGTTPPIDGCPPSAAADLEPRPAQAPVTDDEQLQLDLAGLRVLGTDRHSARELGQAQERAWGARQATRITQTRDWCRERQKPGFKISRPRRPRGVRGRASRRKSGLFLLWR